VGVALVLAAASVVYTLAFLTFKTSPRDLLPQDQPYILRWAEYTGDFGDLDDVAIAVEAPSLAEAKEYATRLVGELRARGVPLRRISYRIDPKQFEGRALLYLSPQRLEEIRDKVYDNQELMEAFAARPTLDTLVQGISTQVASGFASGFLDLGLSEAKGPVDLRFIDELVTQISQRLDRPLPYRSPFGSLFNVPEGDERGSGYFMSEDHRLLFILAEPISQAGSFTDDRVAIEGMRAAIASLKRDYPNVQVGVTGKPALSNDEMTAAFRDSEHASILSFVLTLGLLLLAFMRVGKPVLMLLVLSLSLCWSIGVATLVVGHLSLFSVMFISIVIGIGIDYGIYFLFRYEEELFLGRSLREAIEITAGRSGPGMLLGAVTAGGTFFVLMLTDFRGLQELGFISGVSILLAWVAMMTVFPAVLVILDRRHDALAAAAIPRAMKLESIHVPLVDQITRHPRTVLAVAALLTLLALWGVGYVRFDYNLLNLQAAGTESVVWERRILSSAGRSGFAALASASSLEEVREKRDAFAKLSTVSEVDSALLFIPSGQPEKLKIIRDFAGLVGPIKVGRSVPVDMPRLLEELESLRRRLDIGAKEAPAGAVKAQLTRTSADVARLLRKLRQLDPETSEPILNNLQRQIARDFTQKFQRLQANLNPSPIGLDNIPADLKRKFISDKGRFLLQIHPKVDIWEREGASQFVSQLRGVDPEVTGTPIITYEAINLMQRAYKQGTVYAIVLVAGAVFVMLRRVRETLLALLPLALGLIWTGGLMALFRLDFTMGNVFGLPLILGAAAEYGLNIVVRHAESRHDPHAPLVPRSTLMAVLVNGLTTVAGFGSLMLADHRGIFGLGLLLTLGTAASMVAALIVLPVILQLLRPRPPAASLPALEPAAVPADASFSR
jgi:hopanoid biosynthesis associated RND transporter like protein HpnN